MSLTDMLVHGRAAVCMAIVCPSIQGSFRSTPTDPSTPSGCSPVSMCACDIYLNPVISLVGLCVCRTVSNFQKLLG